LFTMPHPNAVASEATVRLHGELTAEGFQVRVAESPASQDLRASLEAAAGEADVVAVVAILADSPADPVELWVIDRVTRKTVIRRVRAVPASDRAAEVLSIRALELLRASFLEIAIDNPPPDEPRPPAPPPEVIRMTDIALDAGRPRTWAIEVGACVLGSWEGLPPSVVPVLRVEHSWREVFIGRLTLAGLGTRAKIETQEGSASVTQEFALVEAAIKLRPGRRLQPFTSVGTGVLHVTAVGSTALPYRVRTGTLWTPVADVGAGARLALRRRFELALELHAQMAARYPAIQFFGDNVAWAGRPTVVGSLTLVAWL
jgi:hypothetical protein